MIERFKAYVNQRVSAPWIGSPGNEATGLPLKIVRRALLDVGLCEDPPGSNRSGRIDQYNKLCGVPAGSYWCASAVSAWVAESGGDIPSRDPASCDAWRLRYVVTQTPEVGSIILYGKEGDAQHIGIVVRVKPYLMTVEGNTTLDGYSRNGEAVTIKVPKARILGFIKPVEWT